MPGQGLISPAKNNFGDEDFDEDQKLKIGRQEQELLDILSDDADISL